MGVSDQLHAPAHLSTVVKCRRTHWEGGCVGLEGVEQTPTSSYPLLPLPGIKPYFLRDPTHRSVTILTELFWLLYFFCYPYSILLNTRPPRFD